MFQRSREAPEYSRTGVRWLGVCRSADCCCDYADTQLQRHESGDRDKANALLQESLVISNELGIHPLMVRVVSRREILGA